MKMSPCGRLHSSCFQPPMCPFSTWENFLSTSFPPGFLSLVYDLCIGGSDICIGKSGRVCIHLVGNIKGGWIWGGPSGEISGI